MSGSFFVSEYIFMKVYISVCSWRILFRKVMSAVVAVVGAAAVGEPAAADPFVSLAANGMKDGRPPVVDGEQDHADQIFEQSPDEIKHAKHDSHKTAVSIALAGQLNMITSAFRTSWIQSHV